MPTAPQPKPLSAVLDELEAKMAQATPGPYETQSIADEGYERGQCFIIAANLGGLVAVVAPQPTEIDTGDWSRVRANAALIVAAVNALPQLIAAARDVPRLLVIEEECNRVGNDLVAAEKERDEARAVSAANDARDLELLREAQREYAAVVGRAKQAEAARAKAEADAARLRMLLLRYRKETPLGHQPHMIAHEVDAVLEGKSHD